MYKYAVTNFRNPWTTISSYIHPVYERFESLEDAKAFAESIVPTYREIYIHKLCLVVTVESRPNIVYTEPK